MPPKTELPAGPLSPLDRRIVGALQVDGRASWRKIAAVLGEPERSVARRGARLLADGLVVVTGLSVGRIGGRSPWILRVQCAPGTARLVAGALARRRDTTFTYVATGTNDVVAELLCTEEYFVTVTLEELPAIPGVGRINSAPVLHLHRTVHDWAPDVLTPDEHSALVPGVVPDLRLDLPRPALSPVDRTLLRALSEDGRRNSEELARLCGVSETTARRRVDALRAEGVVYFRAVVEPALLGLPVEALLWLRVRPDRIGEAGAALTGDSAVRYAAELAADANFLVDVTAANRTALRELISTASWSTVANEVEVSFVVESLKRSAILSSRLRVGAA